MIRLGFRLTLNGGREAFVRLAVTAAAVALGVGLLLAALAGRNAIETQNARTAWLNTSTARSGSGSQLGPANTQASGPGPNGPANGTATGPTNGPANGSPHDNTGGATTAPAANPAWWTLTADHFGSQTIDRVDIAATGPDSPLPPGISHLPGPGQYYASPALARLLRTTPASQLAARYPGVDIGTIGSSALPAPNSLIIVIGHTAAELSGLPHASQISRFNTSHDLGRFTGLNANKLETVLAVGSLALLFPVLIFIATATRLSAARREQRFAAMRLVGATPRQVSVIAAIEASVAAVAGVAIGFGVFFLIRPALASIPFTGAPFAPGDLSLGLGNILLVAIGVPIAAAVAARVALHRVQISPLGVSRRVAPPAPRAYRVVPLLAGVVELAYFVDVGHPKTTSGQIDAYLSGCLLIMAGLVIAGPWLTMVGARLVARRTSRPAALIAGRRLSDNPRGAFRSISGLILALFATSVSVGVITTILDTHSTASGGAVASDTLLAHFVGAQNLAGQPVTFLASVPAGLAKQLGSIGGVQGVAIIHVDPSAIPSVPKNEITPDAPVLVACAELALTPALGRCPPGAGVVSIPGSLGETSITRTSSVGASVWPAVAMTPEHLQKLPVRAVAVATNGSRAAIEQARTDLEVAVPNQEPPATVGQITAQNARQTAELRQMTNVVIAVSLVIAGCSLAVSVTAGVNERKRPFSLLRLTGVPLSVLRRVVALEAAVPLLVISVLSVGMGFVAAGLFLKSQLDESLRAPGLSYYVVVLTGLIASLGIIASTFPIIERITGPEIARNE